MPSSIFLPFTTTIDDFVLPPPTAPPLVPRSAADASPADTASFRPRLCPSSPTPPNKSKTTPTSQPLLCLVHLIRVGARPSPAQEPSIETRVPVPPRLRIDSNALSPQQDMVHFSPPLLFPTRLPQSSANTIHSTTSLFPRDHGSPRPPHKLRRSTRSTDLADLYPTLSSMPRVSLDSQHPLLASCIDATTPTPSPLIPALPQRSFRMPDRAHDTPTTGRLHVASPRFSDVDAAFNALESPAAASALASPALQHSRRTP
ncbi:hypothetical protein R3P38DRAFT_3246882 [Favolaschia claudopus]|uniref:Uncharacterized protein n=1 Tax=Favolaschia claudopus TaxID=2862362 RepID=A0AAV9YYG9_9AGAR